MKENKIILGLDCSTKKSGFSIFKNNKLFDYGMFIADGDIIQDRMKKVYFQILSLIEKYDVNIIILEDVPVNNHNNLKTGKDLSILQGIILSICFDKNIEYKLYNPSSWRSIIGTYDGTRAGTKRDVQKQKAVDIINEEYNLDLKYFKTDTKTKISDDDIAEAILISRAYLKGNKED